MGLADNVTIHAGGEKNAEHISEDSWFLSLVSLHVSNTDTSSGNRIDGPLDRAFMNYMSIQSVPSSGWQKPMNDECHICWETAPVLHTDNHVRRARQSLQITCSLEMRLTGTKNSRDMQHIQFCFDSRPNVCTRTVPLSGVRVTVRGNRPQ